MTARGIANKPMPKKKENKETAKFPVEIIETVTGGLSKAISEIEISFGNADDNLLKDKINELVRAING